jgi:hypothetical protein
MIVVAAAERALLVIQPGQMPAEILDGDWIEGDGVIATVRLSIRDLGPAVDDNPGVLLSQGGAIEVDFACMAPPATLRSQPPVAVQPAGRPSGR